MRQKVSVVVPVYNNQPTLAETCRQVRDVHATSFSDLDLEIIFVNDGSKDQSWSELQRLKAEFPDQITLINLTRNFGQHGALLAGFNHALGDAVICVSADLQDSIELMAHMVAYWKNNTDIVICYRKERSDGFLAGLSSRLAYSIVRMTYKELPQGSFDYWLMSQEVCKLMCSFKGRHNIMQGQLLSIGRNKAFIPYTRVQRAHGKSGYTFLKKLGILIDFVVDSSYLPVRVMSGLGVAVSFAGLIYALLIAYARLNNNTPFEGWAPLMILVLLIGGMIMIMLGVIGEYVWRIYDNLCDFPLFIVGEKRDAGQPQSPLITAHQ